MDLSMDKDGAYSSLSIAANKQFENSHGDMAMMGDGCTASPRTCPLRVAASLHFALCRRREIADLCCAFVPFDTYSIVSKKLFETIIMSTKTYEEYDKVRGDAKSRQRVSPQNFARDANNTVSSFFSRQEFQTLLSKVRRNLASTRSKTSLLESERLLQDARQAAVGMVGLAEIENNPEKIRSAQLRMEREIRPLQQEITSALKLFGDVAYQAPSSDLEAAVPPPAFLTTPRTSMDTTQLIAYSDQLLQESQA
jgi:hypothetical protein